MIATDGCVLPGRFQSGTAEPDGKRHAIPACGACTFCSLACGKPQLYPFRPDCIHTTHIRLTPCCVKCVNSGHERLIVL